MLSKVKLAGVSAKFKAKKAANKAGDAARKFGEEHKLGEKLTNVKNATVTASKKVTRKGKKVGKQLAKKLKSIGGGMDEEEEDLPLAYYRVKYAYTPQLDEQECLFIEPGDRLQVLKQPNEQWWYAVNTKGVAGYVPSHCLLPIREKIGHFNYLDNTTDDLVPEQKEKLDEDKENRHGKFNTHIGISEDGIKKSRNHDDVVIRVSSSSATTPASSFSSSSSASSSSSSSSSSSIASSSLSSAPVRLHANPKRRLTVCSEDGSVQDDMSQYPSPSAADSPGAGLSRTMKHLTMCTPLPRVPPPTTLPRPPPRSGFMNSTLKKHSTIIKLDNKNHNNNIIEQNDSVSNYYNNNEHEDSPPMISQDDSNIDFSPVRIKTLSPATFNRSVTQPELLSPPRRKPPPAPEKAGGEAGSSQKNGGVKSPAINATLTSATNVAAVATTNTSNSTLRVLTNVPILDAGVAENANERFRPTMEDAHVIELDLVPPQALAMLTSRENTGYFAVYDGHGGKVAVDLVEQNLHRHLQHELNSHAPEVALRQAFLKTDAEMKGKPAYAECGSTVVCALILPSSHGRTLWAANAGDARAVLARVGTEGTLEAVRLTRDHKPDVYEESVRVAKSGGWVMRGRLDGSLAVSRALGDFNYKERGLIADPDVLSCELDERHLFLILACDGLWDVVKDEEAVLQVRHLDNPRSMAQTLVNLALNKGTTDNVTVMVVRLQKNPSKRNKLTSGR